MRDIPKSGTGIASHRTLVLDKFFLECITLGIVVYFVSYQDEHAGLQFHHFHKERISLRTRRKSINHITNGSEVSMNVGHGLYDVVSINNKLP